MILRPKDKELLLRIAYQNCPTDKLKAAGCKCKWPYDVEMQWRRDIRWGQNIPPRECASCHKTLSMREFGLRREGNYLTNFLECNMCRDGHGTNAGEWDGDIVVPDHLRDGMPATGTTNWDVRFHGNSPGVIVLTCARCGRKYHSFGVRRFNDFPFPLMDQPYCGICRGTWQAGDAAALEAGEPLPGRRSASRRPRRPRPHTEAEIITEALRRGIPLGHAAVNVNVGVDVTVGVR